MRDETCFSLDLEGKINHGSKRKVSHVCLIQGHDEEDLEREHTFDIRP